MKLSKKIPAALCAGLALPLAIMPMCAWTSAEAETENLPARAETASIVQPLFGGDANKTFYFGATKVTVVVYADNWIWPAIDQAKVTITSESRNTYYGFKVNFVWTNKAGKSTTWMVPKQYDPAEKGPMQLLEMNGDGYFAIDLDQNCKGNGVYGNAGSGWACAYIEMDFAVKIEGYPTQTHSFGPIYF